MKARRVTGYFDLPRRCSAVAAPVAAANAADRIAIKIDVIGPLGMRVLEMHSLLEGKRTRGDTRSASITQQPVSPEW